MARPDRPDPRAPRRPARPRRPAGVRGYPGERGRCGHAVCPVAGGWQAHACGACAAAADALSGTIHAHWPLHIETIRTAALTLRLTLGEIRLSTQGRGKVPNGVILIIPVLH